MISFFRNVPEEFVLVVIVAFVISIIISLSLHEFAHAFVATKNGDPTPKIFNRVTINPVAHFDVLGFLMIIFFGFGWAKPVPINPMMFRNYKKGYFLTAIAGVVVNFILAFIFYPLMTLVLLNITNISPMLWYFLFYFVQFMFSINIILFVFNLLPIHPLDGFKVVEALSKNNNKFVEFMKSYGTIILIAFLVVSNHFEIIEAITNFVSKPIRMFWDFVILNI